MVTRNTGAGKRGAQAQANLADAMNSNVPVFPYPDSLDPDFREIWVRTVNTKTADYWSLGDIPILEMYCRCAHDVARLSEEIKNEGETILNARENVVVNPKIMIRGFAEGRLLSLCTKLRLQPASRMDSKNEANQGNKKAKANRAATTIGNDEDDLLAGGSMVMQ